MRVLGGSGWRASSGAAQDRHVCVRRELLLAALALLGGAAACDRRAVAQRTPPGRVYVSNEDSGDVTIIDGERLEVLRTIPVGRRPRGLRLDAAARRLYVAVSGAPKAGPNSDPSQLPPPDLSADAIVVVDLERAAVERRLPSGRDPEAFGLAGTRGLLFVSNEETAQTSVINLESGRIERAVAVGAEPEGVELSPDGKFVYVASEAAHCIDVIAVGTLERVARIPTGLRPRAIGFTADGALAYVTNELGASVSVIDARAHVLKTSIALDAGASNGSPPPRPMGVAIAPDDAYAYVTTGRASGIAVIEIPSNRVVRTIAGVGARPWGIGVSADGSKLYTANGPSNDVSVLEAASGRLIRRIAAGRSPWGIAVDRG